MHAIKPLKIMFWNAQSVSPKLLLLQHTLLKEKIDILLIVETFLKPKHNFKLNGYSIHRNDRLNQPHGGVAIAVRDGLSHKIHSPFATNHIENIAIEVSINNTPTNIIAAYCPKYSSFFTRDIEILTSSNNQFLLFGDFNAKHSSWNCSINNKAGVELFNLQQSNNFLIHNSPDPTHYPHSGQTPSTIDILLSNTNFSFEFANYFDQMASDHVPTICNINAQYQQTANIRFNYSKANWRSFRRHMENSTNSLTIPANKTQIDGAIKSFTRALKAAQQANIPTHSYTNKPQITEFTKQLIQLKMRYSGVCNAPAIRSRDVVLKPQSINCKRKSVNWFVMITTIFGIKNSITSEKVVKNYGK